MLNSIMVCVGIYLILCGLCQIGIIMTKGKDAYEIRDSHKLSLYQKTLRYAIFILIYPVLLMLSGI